MKTTPPPWPKPSLQRLADLPPPEEPATRDGSTSTTSTSRSSRRGGEGQSTEYIVVVHHETGHHADSLCCCVPIAPEFSSSSSRTRRRQPSPRPGALPGVWNLREALSFSPLYQHRCLDAIGHLCRRCSPSSYFSSLLLSLSSTPCCLSCPGALPRLSWPPSSHSYQHPIPELPRPRCLCRLLLTDCAHAYCS